VDAAGKASFTIATLSVGSHTITAAYSDGTSYGPSNNTVAQTVNIAPTTTGVSSSLNPSTFSQAVTFTATVTSGGSAVTTGSVTFKEGATVLSGPTAVDATGKASFTVATLAVGNHTITAAYSDGPNFDVSNGTLVQAV